MFEATKVHIITKNEVRKTVEHASIPPMAWTFLVLVGLSLSGRNRTFTFLSYKGMPSGFGHILFGQLPSMDGSSDRLYLKPELFGIRELKQFVQHAKSYFEHVSRRYVCQLPEMKEQPDCSAEEVFRENTDKKLLNNWKDILTALPLSLEMREESVKNATRYGIGEIYRQTNAFGTTYPRKDIEDFRRAMIEQYGQEDISMRKGREIIFTSEGFADSPLTCEFSSQLKKCVTAVN